MKAIPSRNKKNTLSFGKKLLYTSQRFVGMCVTMVPVGVIVQRAHDAAQVKTHLVDEIVNSAPVRFLLSFVIVVGPLIEELTYRTGLIPKNIPLGVTRGSFVFIVLFFSLSILRPDLFTLRGTPTLFQTLFLALLLYIFCVVIVVFAFRRLNREGVFQRYYSFRRWFLILFFGFAHITNFEISPLILRFSPLLVLPQIVLGYSLAYIRVSYGRGRGYLFHAVWNSMALIGALLITQKISIELAGLLSLGFLTLLSIGIVGRLVAAWRIVSQWFLRKPKPFS